MNGKDEPSTLVQDLQFGSELEFFKKMRAKPTKALFMQGKETIRYQIEAGDTKLALSTYGEPEPAMLVGLVSKNKKRGVQRIWASAFRPQTFRKAEGINMEEVKTHSSEKKH